MNVCVLENEELGLEPYLSECFFRIVVRYSGGHIIGTGSVGEAQVSTGAVEKVVESSAHYGAGVYFIEVGRLYSAGLCGIRANVLVFVADPGLELRLFKVVAELQELNGLFGL